MSERFTDDVRAVLRGANARAGQRVDTRIQPGDLLPALLDAENTPGAFALAALGVRREAVTRGLDEAPRRRGPGWLPAGLLRRGLFTREAKKILEESLRVALARHERTFGDEHVLLAMTVRPGAVRNALAACGVTSQEVERVLGQG
ncbi:hypothetical protein SRB5_70390 [Streptomyces sp. RB5]|uniref:Clp R domain-containing protein n=1 Tax=Streptomyces smaragdinus TaxID=2585196 RepID=A0A7K0CTL8_9ACTN|nr:Clp protease N-terminal domain-containing protein [Streptomyces smaragdinus]MQY16836.1 hypothetical protein [Streptomyces smaragdinus]